MGSSLHMPVWTFSKGNGAWFPHSFAVSSLSEHNRQRNMDYVLNWILAFLNGITNVIVLYDIMCQYFVHLYDRFQKSPHLHMPPGLKITRGIGQFHVHGHIPKCFPRFSCNFISGAGVQDREIIETLWNKTNTIADSTRGMSAAHRREVIDDHMNDSNWMKLTRISAYFCSYALFRSHNSSFIGFFTQQQFLSGSGKELAKNGDPHALHLRSSQRHLLGT